MIVQNNVKCSICGKIFCCFKCRSKHEEISHVSVSCPICYNQKFVLRSSIDSKLLNHIAEKHLPLRCIKCSKVYVNTIDILNITQCSTDNKQETYDNNLASSHPQSSVHSLVDNKVTPISMVEVQWNLRNKISAEYVADNLSSLKNLSLINNSVPSKNDNKGTVVRSTSTPMQGEISYKQKENVFDSSSCINHVSSIYASGSESEVSPPIIVLTPTSPKPDIVAERLNKLHMVKSFNKKPVTPLRQVISNSIRRAITQHGIENLKNQHLKPKKIFNCSGSPLDLRTSPAIRRVQSEIIEKSYSFGNFDSSKTSTRKSLSISSKKTTESILIQSTTKSSVYTTCRSISVITSTELQELSVERDANKISSSSVNSIPLTPKTGGIKKKKTIDFETPMHLNSGIDDDDVFYTPMSIVSNKRDNSSLNINDNEHTKETENSDFHSFNTEVKQCENKTETNKKNGGTLWSMVTSMIQIPSFVKKQEVNDNSQSFLKRCASFAGYVSNKGNTTDNENELQSLKRRRNTATDSIEAAAKRLKRIQGRKPIERMRKFSIQRDIHM